MPHDLILGTAGHIDHGKTSLVKALTGVDCDRLPEEKARGITIDIGFANLSLGDYRLGIVDVPGHERFIRNMLAGSTGIDLALLVVAADDSVMPQTREHLEILKLLGIRQGVIALTKVDLVDDTTRDVVELEIRELVAGSFLEAAPVVATSAETGQGIAELKSALRAACERVAVRDPDEWFRLAIDRAFVVQGHGTVVTGSITSGTVRVGDELEWHKGNGTSEAVRVRGLNNHGQPVEVLHRGQRAAINLAGVPHDAIRRGQELAKPGYLSPSRVLTVRVATLADAPRPIKHRLPVRVHIGTAEVMGTVSVLDADAVAPGQNAIAQLFLDEPVVAVWGQPFVLRDSAAGLTLGGGQVLQPNAIKLRRRHLDSIVQVERLGSTDPRIRAEAASWFTGFAGCGPDDLVRAAGLTPREAPPVVQQLADAATLIDLRRPAGRPRLLHADRMAELDQKILDTLQQLHEENPLATSHERNKTLARLDYLGDEALLQAATDRLIRLRKIVGDAKRIAHAAFKPKLSANQRKLKDKIVDVLHQAGFQPPEPSSFANQAGGNAGALSDIFDVACAEGLLVRVTHELYLHSEAEGEMRRRVREMLTQRPGATVAEIRDLLQTTRKYAVPLCEYLDRVGVTKRTGDQRALAEQGTL